MQQKLLGIEHPEVAGAKTGLAVVLYKQGKYEAAAISGRQALCSSKTALGPSIQRSRKASPTWPMCSSIDKTFRQGVATAQASRADRRNAAACDLQRDEDEGRSWTKRCGFYGRLSDCHEHPKRRQPRNIWFLDHRAASQGRALKWAAAQSVSAPPAPIPHTGEQFEKWQQVGSNGNAAVPVDLGCRPATINSS